MSEFNPGLPSIRWLQKALQDRQSLEIKLINGEVLLGQLKWQDPDCIYFALDTGSEILLWKQAVAYIKKSH
ncbi:MAG: RNA-binding protein hfq [Cyanobacteriota bacterium]|nr:RNA-binding protein hfq [Cyanobacteriota bacterium]